MSDLYSPFEQGDITEQLLKIARGTNTRRDKIEEDAGFASPGEGTWDLHLRTAIIAIGCGIAMVTPRPKRNDPGWQAIAEGLAMVQDVEKRIRIAMEQEIEKK